MQTKDNKFQNFTSDRKSALITCALFPNSGAGSVQLEICTLARFVDIWVKHYKQQAKRLQSAH